MPPETGLYIIKRGVPIVPQTGAHKTLTQTAHNQLESDFDVAYRAREGATYIQRDNKYCPNFLRSWSSYPLWMFVQDDMANGLATVMGFNVSLDPTPMGPEAIFKFPSPGVSYGTITNVAIHAYIRGTGKTVLQQGTQKYYGEVIARPMEGWIVTNYTTSPAGPWTWNLLAAGNLKAGIYLDVGEYASAGGGWVPYGWSGVYIDHPFICWDWEGCIYPPGSAGSTWALYSAKNNACYKIKVIISYVDSHGAAHDITLWPSADVSSDQKNQLAQFVDNPLRADISLSKWVSEEQFGFSVTPTPYAWKRHYQKVKNLPPVGQSINNVILKYKVAQNSLDLAVYVAPFLKSGSSWAWGPDVLLPKQQIGTAVTDSVNKLKNTFSWTSNPFTGGAWTRDALAAIEYGLSFTSWEDNVICYIYYNKLDIYSNNSAVVTSNSIGEVTGPATLYQLWPLLEAGGTKRYTANLAEMPPEGSIINSFKMSYAYSGFGSQTVKPFLYINGQYYYGTTRTIASHGDPSLVLEYDHTWTLNPKTLSAFLYSDLHGLRYGIEISGSGRVWLQELETAIDFDEAEIAETEYNYLEARIISFEKVFQNPITSDVFVFAADSFIPERTPVMYFDHGAPVFLGIIWSIEQISGGYIFTAKGQQILLEYRTIPLTAYHSGNGLYWSVMPEIDPAWGYNVNHFQFSGSFEMNDVILFDIFSDAVPTHPNNYHRSRVAYQPYWDYHYYETNGIPFWNNNQSRIGLFYLLNSYVPTGLDSGSGKLEGFAKKAIDKPIFATNHNQMSVLATTFKEKKTGTITDLDELGGVRILQKGPHANPMPISDYYSDEQDIYVSSPADNRILLVDHWADTFIRPGKIDLTATKLNMPYYFHGKANTCFEDFASKLDQEIGFRILPEGLMLFDLVDQAGRGSEAIPIKKFSYKDCTITKTVPDVPKATAIIGIQDHNSISAIDFSTQGEYIIQSKDFSLVGRSLDAELQRKLELDDTLYKIQSNNIDYQVVPGDWISIEEKNHAPISKRIKTWKVRDGLMIIEAGSLSRFTSGFFHEQKQIIAAKKRKMGGRNRERTLEEWQRGKTKANDTKEAGMFDFLTPEGTTHFVIKADDATADDFQVRLKINWELNTEVTELYPAILGGTNRGTPAQFRGNITAKYIVTVSRYWREQIIPPDFPFHPITYVDHWYMKYKVKDKKVSYGEDGKKGTKMTWGDWKPEIEITSNFNKWIGLIDSNDVYFRAYDHMDPQNYLKTGDWLTREARLQVKFSKPVSTNDSWLVGPDSTNFPVTSEQIMQIKINDKIVPPGRIQAKGVTGSIDIDITDYCQKSTSEDITNDLYMKLFRGTNVASGPIHVLKGKVTQYRRIKPVV